MQDKVNKWKYVCLVYYVINDTVEPFEITNGTHMFDCSKDGWQQRMIKWLKDYSPSIDIDKVLSLLDNDFVLPCNDTLKLFVACPYGQTLVSLTDLGLKQKIYEFNALRKKTMDGLIATIFTNNLAAQYSTDDYSVTLRYQAVDKDHPPLYKLLVYKDKAIAFPLELNERKDTRVFVCDMIVAFASN